MLTSFLKKLLLTRQFSMTNGRISMLGAEKVMLPLELVLNLNKDNDCTKELIKVTKVQMQKYAKNLGTNNEGIKKILPEIFETFGVGMLEIIEIKENQSRVIINNPINNHIFISSLLKGMFSYIYDEEKINILIKKEKDRLNITIKRG